MKWLAAPALVLVVALSWHLLRAAPQTVVAPRAPTPPEALANPPRPRLLPPSLEAGAPAPEPESSPADSVLVALDKEFERAREAAKTSPDEAEKILRALQKKYGDHPAVLAELGFFLLEEKHDFPGAISSFEKALAINPNHPDAISALVHAYDGSKNSERGLAFLNKLLDKDPANALLHVGLGDLLARGGNGKVAIAQLERAVQKADHGEHVEPFLAMLYLRNGDPARGTEIFRQRLAQREREAELPGASSEAQTQADFARLDLAFAHFESGRREDALALVRAVLRRDPQNPQAKALLSDLQTPAE